jgi:hypothetical protein
MVMLVVELDVFLDVALEDFLDVALEVFLDVALVDFACLVAACASGPKPTGAAPEMRTPMIVAARPTRHFDRFTPTTHFTPTTQPSTDIEQHTSWVPRNTQFIRTKDATRR